MKRLLLAALLAGAVWGQLGGADRNSAARYSKDGKLALPDYRQWVFLASGLGMSYTPVAEQNPNPSFENVFVNPAAYQAFLKTGTWPDKTVLILEIRHSDTKVSINKDGRVQTDLARIEAHVKDASRGGWVFYAFAAGAQEGDLFPRTQNCYSCHGLNGAVDTTFVQFYPPLIEAAKGEGDVQGGGTLEGGGRGGSPCYGSFESRTRLAGHLPTGSPPLVRMIAETERDSLDEVERIADSPIPWGPGAENVLPECSSFPSLQYSFPACSQPRGNLTLAFSLWITVKSGPGFSGWVTQSQGL